MMTTQSASVREKDPVQCSLQSISETDASKVDRSAMRTPGREHLVYETSSLASLEGLFAAGVLLLRNGDDRSAGRLASRATLTCSGVLKSGSESRSRPLSRETWRLCRFASLLSIYTFCSTSRQDDRTPIQKRARPEELRRSFLLFEWSLPLAVFAFEATHARLLHQVLVAALLLQAYVSFFGARRINSGELRFRTPPQHYRSWPPS